MTEYKLINLRAVMQLTSLGKTTIYELVRDGQFPLPIQLTPRRVAWNQSEVEQWVRERMYKRGLHPSDSEPNLAASVRSS